MRTRTLGASGLEVGAVGYGCMGLNWEYGAIPTAEAVSVIHRAIDLGSTLLDTADVYGPHTNETLVGQAIADRRDEVVVCTKGGQVLVDPATYRAEANGSPEYLRSACEGSLRRLGLDRIDVYLLHRPDPDVPIEESVGALGDLVDEGKVRSIGLSECDLDTLERAWATRPFTMLQSELSLWTREPLEEIVPWCERHDVAFVPYAPLGRGFFAGRVRSFDELRPDDFRTLRQPRFQPDALQANLGLLERVEEIARRLDATPAQVALAWVLAQGPQIVPIPGTKRISALEENVAAAALELSPDDLAELAALPAAVGERY